MYKISVTPIWIALLIIVFSCKAEKEERETGGKVINVNILKASSLNYDSYYKKSKLIPLETLNNSLIGEISKLYLTDTHILIFDKKNMAIMLFDIDGKFERQIGTKGNGPGEYIHFNDIQFEAKTSLIYAHERFQNSIFTYNLSGELINKSPTIPWNFNSFYKTEAGYWIYSCFKKNNPEGYNLILLDEDLSHIKASYFPQKEFVNITDQSTFITDHKDNLYFYYPSSNMIYRLKEDSPVPFCTIHFGNRTMPYQHIREIKEPEEYDKLVADKKYLGDISDLAISNDLLYFTFRETGFGIITKTYNCYYRFSINDLEIVEKPFIEGIPYPVTNKLLGTTNKAHIYPLDISFCIEESFSYLSGFLSAPVSFDSNAVLAVFDLK